MGREALSRFRLDNQLVLITGGAGKLGRQHAEAVVEAGGYPILVDIREEELQAVCRALQEKYPDAALAGFTCDITREESLWRVRDEIQARVGPVDCLINNAANNPHVTDLRETPRGPHWTRFEVFPRELWEKDFTVGLTGAFLCSQVFGREMAKKGGGVILNIASDLSLIAPDQRIYLEPGKPEEEQMVKPVTYSVVKAGLIGLTKYLSTYWAEKGVRVNALSFAGVYSDDLDPDFVKKLTHLIPMGRMAEIDEYKSAVVFMLSDASAYLTGQNIVIDGGRSVW